MAAMAIRRMTVPLFFRFHKLRLAKPCPLSRSGASPDPRDATLQHLDRFVDMFDMGPKAEDRAAQGEAAVDARSAQHHPPLLLDVAKQALVEGVGIALFR